ncbi:AAA family ATPase, partial [Patescibacteria group bacterium]|nr:AAA family ATPase [Patescibacteria group bacterium]
MQIFKHRNIFAKIWENIDTPEIILLSGARQVGKSSLLKMIQEKLVSDRQVAPDQNHTFDLEQINDLHLWSDQTAVLSLPFIRDSRRHY